MEKRVFLATKFIPPISSKQIITVARFTRKIANVIQYPLTFIKAGPGYGKSSLISNHFMSNDKRFYWINLNGENNELYNFLYDLIFSFRMKHPDFCNIGIRLLKESENIKLIWRQVIGAYINSLYELANLKDNNIVLVLEDLHKVDDQQEIIETLVYLVNNIPSSINIVITSRSLLFHPDWVKWKAKGTVLYLTEEDLSLSAEEISKFFYTRNGIILNAEEISSILEHTEGWAIALEMFSEASRNQNILQIIKNITEKNNNLFDYLALEILDQQPEDIRDFLLKSSILSILNKDISSSVFGEDSLLTLEKIITKGFFIYKYSSNEYRYHKLFRDFLYHRAQINLYPLKDLHLKAAAYYYRTGFLDEAIYQYIKAEDYDFAAKIIIELSNDLICHARFNTLLYWLSLLPSPVFTNNPKLYLILGDVKRIKSKFHEAIHLYNIGESLFIKDNNWLHLSECLIKKALVYLDTVQPCKAEPLLRQALCISKHIDGYNPLSLYEYIAENNLNMGFINEFILTQEIFKKENREINISVLSCFYLRTGKVKKVIKLLETQLLYYDNFYTYSPQSHRDLKLILSLAYALTGFNKHFILSLSKEVLSLSQEVGSVFTESIACARIGHYYLLNGDFDGAISWYSKGSNLSTKANIPRGKGEPLLGLCLAFGMKGDLHKSLQYGEEGLIICNQAKDLWLESLVSLALGISHFYSNYLYKSYIYFDRAMSGFKKTRDNYFETIVLLWQCILLNKLREHNKLVFLGSELLNKVNAYNYQYILENSSLLTPSDNALVKNLIYTLNSLTETSQIHAYNSFYPFAKLPYHPDYSLFIKALGNFQVCRGLEKVSEKEWIRNKAKVLLQLLITFRGSFLHTEKICELLWPEINIHQAKQNLKVTLHCLNNVLEPNRNNKDAFFITKHNMGYALVDNTSVVIDIDEFNLKAKTGLEYYNEKEFDLAQNTLQEAFKLYQGNYLEELLYEEWIQDKREVYKKSFLEASEKLALLYLRKNDTHESIEVCEKMLSYDCCSENAYKIIITCNIKMKQKVNAVKTYKKCKENLLKELGIKPSVEMLALLKEGIKSL